MAKQATPTEVDQNYSATDEQIVVTWTAAADPEKEFEVRVVDVFDPTIVYASTTATAALRTLTISTNTDDNPGFTDESNWEEHYQVWVIAVANNAEDNSDPGRSYYWVITPSLTVTVGDSVLNLQQIKEIAGTRTFSLVTNDEPVTFTVQNFTSFIDSVVTEFSLPIPTLSGFDPPGEFQDYDFEVNTDGYFNFRVVYDFSEGETNDGWEVFSGFTVNNVGLAMIHTSGTLEATL